MAAVRLRTLPTESARTTRPKSRAAKRRVGIFDGYNDLGS